MNAKWITFVACFLSLAWQTSLAMADDLLAGAEARIDKYRRADAAVVVVDGAGEPVADAEVQIEQTRHAFLFGSNIYRWGGLGEPALEDAYRERFSQLLNYATLKFYWASYERQRGEPEHEYTSRVARWCREQGMTRKGHPLAWNYADPRWLPDDHEQVRSLQMARIEDCVSHFAGLIDRWDVVNEVTHFDRESFVERAPKLTAMWQQVGQLEFARHCFHHARQANPDATLLINDYRTDSQYERVIERLVDSEGKPLYDVIGIQSHMHGGAWTSEKIWDVCERFSRFGVPLHFTEMTIVSGHRGWNGPQSGSWVSTPEGERYQAAEVVRIYTLLFSHPAVEAITWWDFSDNGAWKGAPAGFLRKDMTPKPAYKALRDLIKDKWWTAATVRTEADGRAAFRGFTGQYTITVTPPGEEPSERKLTLRSDGPNVLTVEVP